MKLILNTFDAMKIFIDCEWNSTSRELISMALVAEDGREFYEVIDFSGILIHPWVSQNVIPILQKEPISYADFQHKLAEFLSGFSEIRVIADWPEDIAHFCNCIITGPGLRMRIPSFTTEVVWCNAPSELLHNALYDARGICKELTKSI